MKLDKQLLLGFLEELRVYDEVVFIGEAVFVESLQASDEGSFIQSTPTQEGS